MSDKNAPVMRILDATDKELMTVRKIERDGNVLVIRGKIFGAMPMVAKLTPQEARAALKLLDFKTIWFLLTLLFRRN
jgi:ATP-dependent phosphoenolpyruvate carboxykinase